MGRDYRVYVDDVLSAILKIKRYSKGFSKKRFLSDEKTVDAIIRNLEIIREAIKKLSNNIRSQYPDVEWRKISGLRDILIHEYFGDPWSPGDNHMRQEHMRQSKEIQRSLLTSTATCL